MLLVSIAIITNIWSNPDKATCLMPKLGFLSNRLRFSYVGLFCDVQPNFGNVLEGGGWGENCRWWQGIGIRG